MVGNRPARKSPPRCRASRKTWSAPVGQQHPVDALGHHVPGGQLGQLVLAHHEPLAVRVHQVRALAAQRLADQRLLRVPGTGPPRRAG